VYHTITVCDNGPLNWLDSNMYSFWSI